MSTLRRHVSPLFCIAVLLIATVMALMDTTTIAAASRATGHPARIHDGSCDATGVVAEQLTGVGATVTREGTPIPAIEPTGSPMAFPIEISRTVIETRMSDLLESPHAIVVYASDGATDEVIAYGNIGGALMMQMPGIIMPGDELPVWLASKGSSGRSGVALLRLEVGGKTSVTIYLGYGSSG